MKILHITTDNKFFPMAIRSFERVFPKANSVWVKNRSNDGNLEKQSFDKNIRPIDLINPQVIFAASRYDFIIVHSLDPFWLPLISLLPKKTNLAWIGWGYDYYDLVVDDSDLLLYETNKIKYKEKRSTYKIILSRLKLMIVLSWKKKLKNKFNSLSTVIEDDYWLIREHGDSKQLPPYKPWNYGELYSDYVRGFVDQRVTGNNILVGNSASLTNNHLDIFELLNSFDMQLDVTVPLSYGDSEYKEIIKGSISQYSNIKFNVLEEFVKPEEYTKILLGCGNVIMNHVRQQAVGNIVIALYLGARVYLREDNPVYKFLLRYGFILSSIEELSETPCLLNEPLLKKDVEVNINKLNLIWSLESIDKKTFELVCNVNDL